MTERENRIGRTQSLFRNVNERIAASSERAGSATTDIVCECPDPSCAERIDVPLDEYDDVRERPTRFLVRPGHEDETVARIVERRRGYDIVEKVSRTAARVARQFDPRRRAEPTNA